MRRNSSPGALGLAPNSVHSATSAAVRSFARTWRVGGRSIEVRKKFYKRIADEIHERTGVRKEDVWINLVHDAREDWSFGKGEMQYAPK
jgi:hypothetical protein